MNKRIIGFIFCLILFNVQMFANEIGLRVLGNDQDGYYVNIYWGKQLISDQSRSGELEAYFDNEDYAVREMLQGWKATQVKKENGKIILSGQVYLKRLETDLSVNVIYEIVNKNVVSKQIELQQNNLSTLSKILCKWKQDSVVSLFLYLNSVFKHKHKLIHNQAPV